MNGVRNIPNTVFYCGAEARESVPPSYRYGTNRAANTAYGNEAMPEASNTPNTPIAGYRYGVSGFKNPAFTVLVGRFVF